MGLLGRDSKFDLMVFNDMKDSENVAEANAARDILGLPRVEEKNSAKPKGILSEADGSENATPRLTRRKLF